VDGGVDTVLRIGLLYPDLLGTYGDGGNARILAHRARARGIEVEVLETRVGEPLVEADLYLLGGGEDGPQRLASDLLMKNDFAGRVTNGATVFAVCAGLQILGNSFAVEGNDTYPGLGIVDAVSGRGTSRSVGDMAVKVGDHVLVGFENHGGVTTLGVTVAPLGAMLRGRGNDGAVDGYRAGRVWATYAHGPALALNPWLADELVASATGLELNPFASVADELHRERLASLGL